MINNCCFSCQCQYHLTNLPWRQVLVTNPIKQIVQTKLVFCQTTPIILHWKGSLSDKNWKCFLDLWIGPVVKNIDKLFCSGRDYKTAEIYHVFLLPEHYRYNPRKTGITALWLFATCTRSTRQLRTSIRSAQFHREQQRIIKREVHSQSAHCFWAIFSKKWPEILISIHHQFTI